MNRVSQTSRLIAKTATPLTNPYFCSVMVVVRKTIMKQLLISNKSNNKDACLSGVYGNQRRYLAPMVEIKDIGSRFHRHHPDGYIILNGGAEASRLRDRLKTDGYTFSLFAREHIENGMRILEHFFVVYIDKIDSIHRGKINAKEHRYKCTFEELLAYGKRLCATEEFDQEVFSVKFPDDGDAVWMNPKGEIMMKFEEAEDWRFFTPSHPQQISYEVSFYKYEFPCCQEYRYIVEMDGIVGW